MDVGASEMGYEKTGGGAGDLVTCRLLLFPQWQATRSPAPHARAGPVFEPRRYGIPLNVCNDIAQLVVSYPVIEGFVLPKDAVPIEQLIAPSCRGPFQPAHDLRKWSFGG